MIRKIAGVLIGVVLTISASAGADTITCSWKLSGGIFATLLEWGGEFTVSDDRSFEIVNGYYRNNADAPPIYQGNNSASGWDWYHSQNLTGKDLYLGGTLKTHLSTNASKKFETRSMDSTPSGDLGPVSP